MCKSRPVVVVIEVAVVVVVVGVVLTVSEQILFILLTNN